LTSQVLKYDFIAYAPYKGINHTTLDKNETTMKTYRCTTWNSNRLF